MKVEDFDGVKEKSSHKVHDCFDHIGAIKAEETFYFYAKRRENCEKENHLFHSHNFYVLIHSSGLFELIIDFVLIH